VVVGLLSAWTAPLGQVVDREGATSLGELAAQYRGADREDAVSTVARWTQREVEAETQGVLEAAARAEEARQEDLAQSEATLLAAAALLSEAAVRALHHGNPRRPRWELRAAERLVRATRSTDDSAAFARRFHLVAGLMLHNMADLASAHEMLSEGHRHAEDDPELLLALGAVTETIAALRHYELPEVPRSAQVLRDEPQFAIEGRSVVGGRLPNVNLSDAQALYERAVQRDPGLLEARLRLGRVLLLRGKPREALPELERVWQDSPRPAQCYMARMFEGRARERLGDLRGAAVALAAATERMPQAQSALVALGRALDRLGEGTQAREAFDSAMQRERGRGDPWLDYIQGQPDRIEGLLEELRGLVP
jgi:tetratricopeptide (TPR) repeat protein